MAPKYFKWYQMTVAKANGYDNGPTLFQMVPKIPKWSKTIHNDPNLSNMVPDCQKLSYRVKNGPKTSKYM